MRFSIVFTAIAFMVAAMTVVQAAPYAKRDDTDISAKWATIQECLKSNGTLYNQALAIQKEFEAKNYTDAFVHIKNLNDEVQSNPNYSAIQATLVELRAACMRKLTENFPWFSSPTTSAPETSSNTTNAPTTNTTVTNTTHTGTGTVLLDEAPADQVKTTFEEEFKKFKQWCDSNSNYTEIVKKAYDALTMAHWEEAEKYFNQSKEYAKHYYPDYAKYEQVLEQWEAEAKKSVPFQSTGEAPAQDHHTSTTDEQFKEMAKEFKEWCDSNPEYQSYIKQAAEAIKQHHWSDAKDYYEKAKHYAKDHFPRYAEYEQYLEKWEVDFSFSIEVDTTEYDDKYISELKKFKEDLLKFFKWASHDEYLEAAFIEACEDLDEGNYAKASAEFIRIKKYIKENYPNYQELKDDFHSTTDNHY